MKSLFSTLIVLTAGAALFARAPRASQGQAADPGVRFRNVSASAGIRFVHDYSPATGTYFIESAPGGLAVFDYNGDGRFDLFFTNGAALPSLQKNGPRFSNRLYRNDGRMRFTDVTEVAGVAGVGYAMGAAAADYDNDGDVDLFVAGVRRNQLLRNRGDGRFEDVTSRAQIASGDWAVGGGWFDYDNDGRLDLFVVNYVRWTPETNRRCGDEARGVRIYCDPRVFEGLPNRLYRNRGDGTFEDVSQRSGVLGHVGKGMSVAFGDLDHDGRMDAFVTNDTMPNFLFHNNGDGTFDERALLAGVSVPDLGRPISSMGTDVQDYDNDGWEDIHVTALTGETFPLFRNNRRGAFTEETQSSGLARLTVRASGWCAIVADLDNDGWKDIFTANSHVNDRIVDFQAIAFKQRNSLFINDGQGRFRDETSAAGFDAAAAVHRGCGIADFNGDGRLDLAVLARGTPAELWQNDSRNANHWLIAKLVGTKSNRDGIGARVIVGSQVRTMTTAMGYASSSHAGLHFGLGTMRGPVRIHIEWPSGVRQIVEAAAIDRVVEIREPAEVPAARRLARSSVPRRAILAR